VWCEQRRVVAQRCAPLCSAGATVRSASGLAALCLEWDLRCQPPVLCCCCPTQAPPAHTCTPPEHPAAAARSSALNAAAQRHVAAVLWLRTFAAGASTASERSLACDCAALVVEELSSDPSCKHQLGPGWVWTREHCFTEHYAGGAKGLAKHTGGGPLERMRPPVAARRHITTRSRSTAPSTTLGV
jgi:hypothetical protein